MRREVFAVLNRPHTADRFPVYEGSKPMSDEFLPPGSLRWLKSWPYWMPITLLGVLPPLALPRVPGDQFGGHGLQQSFSASGEAASLPNDPKGGNALAWLDPAISSRTSGGILGSLTQSDGLLNQSLSAWAQSRMPFRASAGNLAPLARTNDSREQSIAAWLQSVSRWPHQPNVATWDPSTLPTPHALAPVFPSAPQRAADSALIQTSAPIPTLDEVLSDADPQELVPGARTKFAASQRNRARRARAVSTGEYSAAASQQRAQDLAKLGSQEPTA